MKDQLQRDIEKRIDERLHQWCVDSADLYMMAGLSMNAAAQDIYISLLGQVIHLTINFDLPIDTVIDSMREVYAKAKVRREKEENDE